jgi:hypothetical protein
VKADFIVLWEMIVGEVTGPRHRCFVGVEILLEVQIEPTRLAFLLPARAETARTALCPAPWFHRPGPEGRR